MLFFLCISILFIKYLILGKFENSFCICFENIFEVDEILKGSFRYWYLLNGVLKVSVLEFFLLS